mmetsp:Transcript_26022/g.102270  ORF Transcript_26022/g.102270 Transcript_26022/m.102270 type:complete len:101 (+) Transcript_26022:1088-1390(+)
MKLGGVASDLDGHISSVRVEGLDMSLHVLLLRKRSVACWALIWFQFLMDRHNMLRQIFLEEERLIAHRTLVPLHLLVNALVVISVRKHLREGKLALVAGN